MASRIAFTSDEEQRVLASLTTMSHRDRCLVVFGLNTGFRASEMAAITVGDVWDGQGVRPEISVCRRFLKGGRGVHRRSVFSRSLPLNGSAREALRNYLSTCPAVAPEAPLFPSQRRGRTQGLQRWQVNRIVRRVARAAGVARLTRIGTHTLRKTFAQKIFQASGHDINATRELLGHRHISTTERYLCTDAERLRSTVLAIG